MAPERITPIHRPALPDQLADSDLAIGQLDDQTVLSHLGMADISRAVDHYRSKLRHAAAQDICQRLLQTMGTPNQTELDEICRNIFTLRAHMYVKHDFGERVDWTTVINNDKESNVAINHHAHIMQLALAYQRLESPDYADHAIRLLRSWFEQSPSPTEHAQLQWRTLEVGGRLSLSWPVIAICLCDYPGFTDRDLFDLIRWTWMSIRYLRKCTGPPNNWLQVESAGALCGLTFLGDIPAAKGWDQLFWDRLDWINSHQFLPDGMQAENSPYYHQFPWWRLYTCGIWIELFLGRLPDKFWPEQVHRASPLWMLRQPDTNIPMLSDCGPQLACPDKSLQFVRSHKGKDSIPDPAALQNADSISQEHRICHLPYAGFTALRTAWRADDDFVLFDHGFYGTNHQHEDKLTFLYAAKGRLLIGDAGIYRYSADEWEHYFRGAAGHNAIMVDSKQQCRTLRHSQGIAETIPDQDSQVKPADNGAVVLSGCYRQGFAKRIHHLWDRSVDRADELTTLDESIHHQRILVWLPHKGVLLIDRLTGSGTHQIDQIFHLWPFVEHKNPAETIRPGTLVIAEPAATLMAENELPGVLLLADQTNMTWTDYCGSEQPLCGWTSLYGIQPSHDLWRSGRLDLPAVLAVWLQPWQLSHPPTKAKLEIKLEADSVHFDVTVNSSDPITGTVHLENLALSTK